MGQVKKVVIRIPNMADAETKQKAMKAVANFQGIDLIEADMKKHIMTIIGDIERTGPIEKKLKDKIGQVEVVSVGPVKEEKKEQKKDKKEQKKDKKEEKLKKAEPKKEEIRIIIGDQLYRIATANAKRVEIVSVGPAKEEKKVSKK